MILASVAAQKSIEAIQNHETEELKDIDKRINKACSNGLRSIYLDTMISVEARKELERCGYKVKLGNQYNELYTVISW